MSSLLVHIDAIEAEIARMTRDGHHAEADVETAMRALDAAVIALHKTNREQRVIENS